MRKPPIIVVGAALLLTAPAAAQLRGQTVQRVEDERDAVPEGLSSSGAPSTRQGQVAESVAGQAGERQSRAMQPAGDPTARVASRIQNRVQSRLRTRIDRDYDPQAGRTSPFLVAEEQVRTSTRPRR